MGTTSAGVSGAAASVFLLAENRLLREALLRILSKKEDVRVAGANSYSPAIYDQIADSGATVVVLDSVARVLGSEGTVRELRKVNPAIRIVMVGMELDEQVFVQVIQAGVLGYVLKDASAAEVARTIRAVAAGEAVCPAALSGFLFQWVAGQRASLPNMQLKSALGLSRREQQLVVLIQEGLTNKEMANRLHLSEQTIKNHVHRMLRKVGASDRLAIVDACREQPFPLTRQVTALAG